MKNSVLFLLFLFSALIADAQIKVSILGDSYSAFRGWIPEGNDTWYGPGRDNDVQNVENTWWYRLIEDNALELEMNNSFSGATICNTGHFGRDYTDRSFVSRSTSLGQNPDIIYVFGGTNDDWVEAPLGEEDGTNLFEVRPAVKTMLKNIKAAYPEAICLVIINTELKPDIENLLINASEAEGVPYVKLRNIDKQKGHPSINGMKAISRQVWKATAPLLYSKLQSK